MVKLADPEVTTYYAATNISLDGAEYPIGAVVPLNDQQAAQISDAVTTTKPADGVQLPDETDTDIGITQDQVVAAIGQLDSDEPTHWTKSGKPQIDALEAQLGVPVSGALRDAAWSEFEA